MVKETKYYDLLEVTPDASQADLKKAYHKRALKLHPDKGGDPEMFKEVTHAYEVLSDSQKRSIYDTRGEAGLTESGGMGGMDPQDLFSQLFGGAGGFFGGGGSRSQGPRKTKDLVHRVLVSLDELYEGKTTKLALTRNIICAKCKGKGGREGTVKTCPGCHGRGVKVIMRQMGPMIQQIQTACDDCSGTGEFISPKDRCNGCKGKKVISDKKTLEVHIGKGMQSGQTIVFRGESDQSPTAEPGDVVIVVEEKPHSWFRREGNDLITTLEIDLLTALAGGKAQIQHFDNVMLCFQIAPGAITNFVDTKVIKKWGMPSHRHHEPGDLKVKIVTKFPQSIPSDSLPKIERALPPRPTVEKEKDFRYEEVDLVVDKKSYESTQATTENDPMDEDDGEPRVQCANQ